MQRKQFTFYRSFWDAYQSLPKNQQLPFFRALCAYALDGEELPLNGSALTAFRLVKPVLDTARRKSEGGSKKPDAKETAKTAARCGQDNGKISGRCEQDNDKISGRYGKDTANKGEREKETEVEVEGEVEGEVEVEVEGEVEVENKCFSSSSSDDEEDPPTPRAEAVGQSSKDGQAPKDCQSVVGVVVGVVGNLSKKARAELDGFVRDMGQDCIQRALDTAQDAGRPTWPYVRGILRRKREQGVSSAEDWDRLEASHAWGGAGSGPGGGRPGWKSDTIAGTPRNVQPTAEQAQSSADWLAGFMRKQGLADQAPAGTEQEAGL